MSWCVTLSSPGPGGYSALILWGLLKSCSHVLIGNLVLLCICHTISKDCVVHRLQMILMKGPGYLNSSVQTLYRLFVVLKSVAKQVILETWKKREIRLDIFSSLGVGKELSVSCKTLICVAFYGSWSSAKQSVQSLSLTCNKHVKKSLRITFSSFVSPQKIYCFFIQFTQRDENTLNRNNILYLK